MNIEKIVEEKTKDYPLYSQENEFLTDKLVLVKLFNAYGAGTWYITEYEPDANVAFGYVTGLVNDPACDEWGYINITELAQLKIAKHYPMIQVDMYFQPKRFGDINIRGRD